MRQYLSALLIASLATMSCTESPAPVKSPAQSVDMFMGSAADWGQLAPSATTPFGMIKVCPDCVEPTHVGYLFENDTISGVSITRLGGVGGQGAGGNISVRPATKGSLLRIDKSSEVASPGYYSTMLSNGVKCELTATNETAIQRYTFPEDSAKNIFIDFAASFDDLIAAEYNVLSDSEISGYVQAKNTCGFGAYKLYFFIDSSTPFKVLESESHSLLLEVEESEAQLRISISSVDSQSAQIRLDALRDLSFDALRDRAQGEWEQILSTVEIKGGDQEQRDIFYTLLYRCFQAPVKVALDGEPYINTRGERVLADGFTYYSSWSIWDTFRTKLPMLALLQPEVMSDMSKSLVELYNSGKENWSTPYEAFPTVRTEHASVVLLDAYRKGIEGVDLGAAYRAIEQDTAKLPLRSPDNFLETAYDMWALGQIAQIVGDSVGAKRYADRSDELWRGVWTQKFKDVDLERFDVMKGDGLYQGTLWQYRWAVPFALDQAAELVGGADKFAEELNYFFENNLYNHGNQPDIHAPFIFNELGQPHRTQYWVNQLTSQPFTHVYGTHSKLDEPFVGMTYKTEPRAFIPEMDDDYGTMSAWYVAAAIGLYPLLPGSNEYQITTPLFEQVTLNQPSGTKFKIKCHNFSKENIYIEKIYLNGELYDKWKITNQEIAAGGTLDLHLVDEPK